MPAGSWKRSYSSLQGGGLAAALPCSVKIVRRGTTIGYFPRISGIVFLAALAAVLSASAAKSSSSGISLDLNGQWQMRRVGAGVWTGASVPGCVHTDLAASGEIDDPFYGCNETGLQWISDTDWEYSKSFLPEASFLGYPRHELVFEGLDTYADVYLNGIQILSADNMFREWRADCGGLLRAGENTVRVVFHSPPLIEERRAVEYPHRLPGGNRVFTRKAAYHYGWDWGPRFVTMGIWKPVRIEAWKDARLRNASFRMEHPEIPIEAGMKTGAVKYNARLEVEADRPLEASIEISIDGEKAGLRRRNTTERAGERLKVDLAGGRKSIELDFEIASPELWWPNGMGKQRLYEVRAAILVDGLEIGAITESIGIRSVDLVREKSGGGESFYFRINGKPVFMKGANWVPMESFPSAASDEKYGYLVESAAEANMNMLRVWGGGIYENDIFYSLCDRYGILVWQDFMFANAMYPWDCPFLDNVKSEATEIVRRLGDHTCVALWCGNNEIDEAWHNWGWQAGLDGGEAEEIWNGYNSLFTTLLPELPERKNAGDIPYISTSPKYGRGDRRSLTEGDSHYWGVWHDAEPFEVLNEKTGRFMSEFGFQSFPAMETVARFTGVSAEAPVPECLDSPELLCHQKHPRGNSLILEYMQRDYKVPKRFDDFVYVSQLLQARGVRMGIEAERRAAPFCMGSLFWQLNDCWPVASWSSIDYFGERKALYYQAAKAFSPELISSVIESDTIKVYFVSDSSFDSAGTLLLTLIDFDGMVLKTMTEYFPAPAAQGAPLYIISIDEMLEDHAPGTVVLKCELLRGENVAAKSLLYFASPKDLVLPDPALAAMVRENPGGVGYIVELRAERLAKDVYLSMPGCAGIFSDNFFDMLPGEKAVVFFETDGKQADPGQRLRIKTLADVD